MQGVASPVPNSRQPSDGHCILREMDKKGAKINTIIGKFHSLLDVSCGRISFRLWHSINFNNENPRVPVAFRRECIDWVALEFGYLFYRMYTLDVAGNLPSKWQFVISKNKTINCSL